MDKSDAALVSRLSAEGGTVFRPLRPAFPDLRTGCAGVAGHAARRRGDPGVLPARQPIRERCRQYHPRGADRGAPDFHHRVPPPRHQEPDTLDGRRHRSDAADRQGRDPVRGPHLRAADARDGDAPGRVRQPGRPRASAAAIDRRQCRDADRDHRGSDQAGRPGRRSPRHRPEGIVPQAPQRQRHGFHRRRGNLRPPGESRRPVRRRRERDQLNRDRTGIGQGHQVDATLGLPILIGLIAVALLFDFLNGLHDAANSIATIVSTRVLRPHYAVFWAAFFNFVAFTVFGLNVARTIGTGIVEPSVIDNSVIFAALIGAIVWNLITWGLGIPSSSSHALIGGLVGGGMAKAGLSAAVWSGLSKTLLAIVLSPAVGFLLALVLVAIVSWASVRSTPFAVDRAFRILQFASASLYSLGHGGNDAQKTMGVIAVLLYSQGKLGAEFSLPFWVVLACQAAMALGTLMGGWRIVRTMGLRITKLTPMQGFCAETGGAATLFMATWLGVPVSTTHTITGAIVGVGAARRGSGGRRDVASSIVYAWVITIPASAIVAALAYWAVGLVRPH